MKSKFILILILISSIPLQPVARASDPDHFNLNPESLRIQILESNLPLEGALNRVKDAKDKVSFARANLLPSVSLGGVLNLTSLPTFMLSSVQFLLPFLMPSNWFSLFEEKNIFEAEKISYKVMQLNTYSQALSLYFTVLSDQQKLVVYQQQAQDLKQMESILEEQRQDFGIVSKDDVEHAQAQAQLSELQASHMTELVIQELAALRNVLNLPLSTQLILDSGAIPASSSETGNIQDAINQAELVSPELSQIQFLVAAAKNERWSRSFGFLGSAALGSQVSASSSTPASFSNIRASGSMSIGLGIFPTIQLSSRNIQEIQLQDAEVRRQTTQVFEASLKSMLEVKKQFSLASDAEQEMADVYQGKKEQYDLGLCSYMTVLLTRTQMTSATLARIQAATDLNLLRTTLHRALITEQFSQIKGCRSTSGSVWRKTVNELCDPRN